jgi:hypothetical protein
MTDFHCPLCGVPLASPPDAEPRKALDVLEKHFEDCSAIRLPRAVARTPEPRHDRREHRDG